MRQRLIAHFLLPVDKIFRACHGVVGAERVVCPRRDVVVNGRIVHRRPSRKTGSRAARWAPSGRFASLQPASENAVANVMTTARVEKSNFFSFMVPPILILGVFIIPHLRGFFQGGLGKIFHLLHNKDGGGDIKRRSRSGSALFLLWFAQARVFLLLGTREHQRIDDGLLEASEQDHDGQDAHHGNPAMTTA